MHSDVVGAARQAKFSYPGRSQPSKLHPARPTPHPSKPKSAPCVPARFYVGTVNFKGKARADSQPDLPARGQRARAGPPRAGTSWLRWYSKPAQQEARRGRRHALWAQVEGELRRMSGSCLPALQGRSGPRMSHLPRNVGAPPLSGPRRQRGQPAQLKQLLPAQTSSPAQAPADHGSGPRCGGLSKGPEVQQHAAKVRKPVPVGVEVAPYHRPQGMCPCACPCSGSQRECPYSIELHGHSRLTVLH